MGTWQSPANFKNPRAVLDDGCSALITFHENRSVGILVDDAAPRLHQIEFSAQEDRI